MCMCMLSFASCYHLRGTCIKFGGSWLLPLATSKEYEVHVTKSGNAWKALGWVVLVWVHCCVRHSAPLLAK